MGNRRDVRAEMTVHADGTLPGYGGDTRRNMGVIVTFENEHGHKRTVHRTGHVIEAMRELCDEALAIDPTYRVVCVSNPETIWRDLQGRRIPDGQVSATLALPEVGLCAKAGMKDMVHPRLRLGRRASGVR